MTQQIRVFISSPGDVEDERRRAALVISRLRREFARFLDIQSVLWEYEPMIARGHFQDIIDPPGTADIVVVILWSRLGTPLPERTAAREYRGIDGRAPVTGTEWEFEQALQAQRERGGTPDLLVYRNFAPGKAEFTQDAQLDQIKQQWQMLQAFWTRHFQSPEGFKLAYNRFTALDEFEQQLEQHLRELLRRRLPPRALRRSTENRDQRIDWWQGSPYRGLQVFDGQHAAVFFGREKAGREVAEALVRRAEDNKAFMLVLGASGSGKSSLVRAGLLPDLTAPGVVSGITTWRRAILTPAELGNEPASGIAAAILGPGALPELSALGYRQAELAETLRAGVGLMLPHIRVALERAANEDSDARSGSLRQARFVLVVDQFEVLFTSPAFTRETRRAFGVALANLAQSGLVWVVATMRSDFFHRLAELPEINELAAGLGQYHLAAPTPAELDLIIGRPAQAAGIGFEEAADSGVSLAATIRDAAARDPASLPLLSFLLDELYRRDVDAAGGDVLTYASYNDLGRLEGAIARHADALAAALPDDVKPALPRLLLSLVQLNESDGTATARTIRQSGITDPAQREAADRLVAARLAVADRSAGETTIRIAHEALLSHWPTLGRLIEEHRDFLLIRRRLQSDAALWQREGRHPDLLLPAGRRLAEAEDTLARHRSDLDAEIVEFTEASISAEKAREAAIKEAAERDLRDKLRRSRIVAAVVSVLLVAAVGLGYFAWHQRGVASAALIEADANYQVAVDHSIGSVYLFVDSYEDAEIKGKIMQRLVDHARQTLDRLRGGSDAVVIARARLFDVLSIANTSLGHLDQAVKDAETQLALVGPLLAREPGRAEWERLRASGHGRLSDALFRKGDSEKAHEHAATAVSVAVKLLAARPDDDAVRRDLIDHHERNGLALRAMGRSSDAIAAQREWLAMATSLSERRPLEPAWRRSIANARQEIGDTLLVSGNVDQATDEYQRSIAIYLELRREDQEKVRYLHLLAATKLRLGEALLRAGNVKGALIEFQEARDLATKLVAVDPSVFPWRHFYEDTYRAVGDGWLAMREPDKAEEQYRRYHQLALESREAAPANGLALFAVSNSHQKIGDVLLARGLAPQALEQYRASLTVAIELRDKFPPRQAWYKNLAMAHQRLGRMLKESGDRAGALEQFRQCVETRFKSEIWAPRNRDPADLLGECHQQVAELERQ